MDCAVVTSHYASYSKRNDSQLANNLIDMSANEQMQASLNCWLLVKNPVDSEMVILEFVWLPYLHTTKILHISKYSPFCRMFSQLHFAFLTGALVTIILLKICQHARNCMLGFGIRLQFDNFVLSV